MKFAHRKNFGENRKIRFPVSTFDLSHSHQGSYDWGGLYPIFCEETSPRDIWNIGIQAVAKMMATIAPVQHELNLFVHVFHVPYRILDENWEDFITGGPDGTDESTLPLWDPDTYDKSIGSLWDHFGFPRTDCTGVEPIAYPRMAYSAIWNEYYRDENLQDEVNIATNNRVLTRAWEKDYFTAALPWQQRGIAPSMPVTGFAHAIWQDAQFPSSNPSTNAGFSTSANDPKIYAGVYEAAVNAKAFFNSNVVNADTLTTFDISDLRAAVQLQRFLERNARGGARYTEVLDTHFDDAPTDERLQRPEYIGGWKQQVTIQEVLQVSESATTPQGTRTGIGSIYGSGNVGYYHTKEYGLIMGIMSIMPRSMYTQGVNRMWLRRTRYDFLWPEFVNLSEQAILTGELFAGATEATNLEIFGYQGRYDELRQRTSRAIGLMRESVDGLITWNLSRKFATAPALNEEFITVEWDELKQRVFAIPSEPGFIITFGNILTVKRALPMIAEPGLIDHV